MESRKNTNLKIIKIFGIALGALIFLAIFSRLTSNDKTSPAKIEKTDTTTTKTDKGIDGMSPVDIYLDLEKKGYKIDKEHMPNDGTFYYCIKNDIDVNYNVTIFKNTNDKVEEVKISASLTGQENKNIEVVKPFLKYISTVPYDGSDSKKITQWVDDNFYKNGAEIIIGPAKFKISGSKFMRMIVITKA